MKKPSEKIFNFLLNKIGQQPEDCLFIDDNSVNVSVAKSLGFSVILFENLSQLRKALDSFGVRI